MVVGRQLLFLIVSKLCWLLMDLVRSLVDKVEENKLKTVVGVDDGEDEDASFVLDHDD